MKHVAEYHLFQVSTNGRIVTSMPADAYVCCAYVMHGYVYISVLQDNNKPYVHRTFLCVSSGMDLSAYANNKRHWFIDRIEYQFTTTGSPINYYIVEEET